MSKFHISLTSTPQLKAEIGKDPAGLSVADMLAAGFIQVEDDGTPAIGAMPVWDGTKLVWSAIAIPVWEDSDIWDDSEIWSD